MSYTAPALLAVLAVFFGFILTGVSFLRERSQGTLERLMASPVSRGELALGYLLGFLIFAMVQSIIILLFTIYALHIQYRGDLWQIFVMQIISTVGAVNLGILVSTYARNEFQVVQFIPLFILPQVFLSGVLWPVEQMPDYLQWVSKFLPLTYAIRGLRDDHAAGSFAAEYSSGSGRPLRFCGGSLDRGHIYPEKEVRYTGTEINSVSRWRGWIFGPIRDHGGHHQVQRLLQLFFGLQRRILRE